MDWQVESVLVELLDTIEYRYDKSKMEKVRDFLRGIESILDIEEET